MSYKWVSNEMFQEKLIELLDDETGESLLKIPGLSEIIKEHFEDEIFEELEEENFPNLMTYEEVNESFKELIKECNIPLDDEIMLREEWNNYTDSLCKDKIITPDNYEDWDNPY